jgi:hypothetical protein
MLEVLRHTPPWVFPLFAALLIWGYAQTRPRRVRPWRVYVLPGVLLILSAHGVMGAFGASLAALGAWAAGVATAVVAGRYLPAPAGAAYSADTGTLTIPGSWWPLALMLAIFFSKYAVGVALGRNPRLAQLPVFVISVSLLYGLLSGVLFARRRALRRAAV